jgi:hypothetical protein
MAMAGISACNSSSQDMATNTNNTDNNGLIIHMVGPVSIIGTIKYVSNNGGFYVIEGDDNVIYDPINLEQEYKVDGLLITAISFIRDDIESTYMNSTKIEIAGIIIMQ